MAKSKWQAYYFNSFDNRAPAARVVLIEADNEEDAGKMATAQMGRCMRVDVTRAVWAAPSGAGASAAAPTSALARA